MPVATPTQYEAMLDAAQKGNYAYPAVNVTSITTINAALKALPTRNLTASSKFPLGAASSHLA